MTFLEDLLLNPHLIPFYVSFMVGFVLLVSSGFKKIDRKGKFTIALRDPFDFEGKKKRWIWGVVLMAFGILGLAIVSNEFGYNTKFTDISGDVGIERHCPSRHNLNADYGGVQGWDANDILFRLQFVISVGVVVAFNYFFFYMWKILYGKWGMIRPIWYWMSDVQRLKMLSENAETEDLRQKCRFVFNGICISSGLLLFVVFFDAAF